MEEARRLGIRILCPDINESKRKFSVNKQGDIRFGLGAVKNVGDNAITYILKDRAENGPYSSLFDFTTRVDKSSCSRRSIEHFVLSGAFDCFGLNRSQYFAQEGKSDTIERAVRFGEAVRAQRESAQSSLFGDEGEGGFTMDPPHIPQCEEWPDLDKLKRERDVVGLFISSHPLDRYRFVLENYSSVSLEQLAEPERLIGQEVGFGGMVTRSENFTARNGNPCGSYTIEDVNSSYELRLYDEKYAAFSPFLFENAMVFIKASILKGWENKATGQTGRPRMVVNSVQLLSEVSKNAPKKVVVTVDVADIDADFIVSLRELLQGEQGYCPVEVRVEDRSSGVSLSMPVRSGKVELSREVIARLEDISGRPVHLESA